MDEAIIKRIMPNNTEAEKSVIGSMLIDKDAVVTVSEILDKEDFYQTSYGVLYDVMVALYKEGKPADIVTVQEKLKESSVMPELSSIDFIKDIINAVPTSANVEHYARIVKDKAILRNLIKVSEKISKDCYEGSDSMEAIMESAEKEIFSAVQQNKLSDYVPIREVVLEALEQIELASRTKGRVTGIESGFYDLDNKLTGFHPSELILVAARPAMGKTAFVLNIAEHVAVKNHITTAIFSLEMSKVQLVNRMLAIDSKVDSQAIRSGNLEDDQWEKLIDSVSTIGDSKLIIDDTPGITINELRTKCRKYKIEHGLQLVIIDYLQLMSGGSKRSESRQQEVSEISRSLKALAREIDAPIIALSQLSRAVEGRPDKRPMLSDLRESGAIEQDADVVMFIYRDDYYNPDTEEKGVAEIIVGKQRSGPTGTVKLGWNGELTKFLNLERVYNN
ncbi:MAG: replicative DNA helicase [Lachnospiraceae bacterium]|nr:replicative DNA helicase [Lachnospiraceae bacterium]